MKAAIDTIVLDDDVFELEVRSWKRNVIQRSAAGLDGQVNIDLGMRGRKILQKGELRGRNRKELQKKIDELNELVDGELHSLKCADGRIFENLLVDEFQTGEIISGGAHLSCKYQIHYTQQG